MTREEFKNVALNILYRQTEYFLGKNIKLFTSDDMERYKVAQYDEDDLFETSTKENTFRFVCRKSVNHRLIKLSNM